MKPDRDAPVGVFDSGVGGLTVAREIMRNLPSEKIVYFGDNRQGSLREQIKRKHYPLFPSDHTFSSGTAGEGHCDRLQHGQRFCSGRSPG